MNKKEITREAKKYGVSNTVIKRATKEATRQNDLNNQLHELLSEYNPNEISTQMVSIIDRYPNKDHTKWLTDEVITYLQIWHNYNLVKIDGVNQQLEFEKLIQNIYPDYNDQRNNLFLKL